MDTFDLIAHRQSPSLTEAWTAMYTALADHRWHPASELVAVVVHHGVSAAAARALLGDAVKSGRLQIGTDEESGTRGGRFCHRLQGARNRRAAIEQNRRFLDDGDFHE